MCVLRRRIAERFLQGDLARRGAQQVSPAYDLRNSLLGIIDNDGQLIGELAVRSFDDEVSGPG